MPANRKLLVLPGDGIGPEVMTQVVRVADWFGDKRAVGFEVQEDLVGGAAYDAHGTPLTDATLAAARGSQGLHLRSCGHEVHARCLSRSLASLRLRKSDIVISSLEPSSPSSSSSSSSS